MPLEMNREVFITCAVTGSGATQDKSPHVPRSPKQIAESAILAAKYGAAVVHCHVRDPETGAPSRDKKMFRAKQLVADGVLEPNALVQLCMGVPWGAPDDLNTLLAMVNNVPDNWTFSAFGLGRNQMPLVAASVLAGGNVRVGLEDNLMLDRGVLAENYQLVDRAREIIQNLGSRILGPEEVRQKLGLVKRMPVNI